ncbi:MAG TPA: NAD(+)/NADH kinase [Acidimicrobiales bacterium]|jgi:NAD+ kinase|nr:NAD(+)/NADH kinase [Acidimicrobiales bacterium]
MTTVALVLHREREQARVLARELSAWLVASGHEVRIAAPDAELAGLRSHGCEEALLGEGADLAVSLGGDGTMLRTVELVAARGVPILGVNVGQMGYLTDVEPSDARDALERFLAGEGSIEQRMLLSVQVERADGSPVEYLALNEAVLEKTPMGHTVRLAVEVEGEFFTTYAADGLIVATPTGSTAYAFSARGPIVAPTHRAQLLTPVSPHMLFDRTLVLEPDARLRLVVQGHRTATLSVDGRNLGELQEGDAISCTAAPCSAHLVTFGPRDFLQILKTKFGLSDR